MNRCHILNHQTHKVDHESTADKIKPEVLKGCLYQNDLIISITLPSKAVIKKIMKTNKYVYNYKYSTAASKDFSFIAGKKH